MTIMNDNDLKKFQVIESKLPFHYDDKPVISKEDVSFLISRINRGLKDPGYFKKNLNNMPPPTPSPKAPLLKVLERIADALEAIPQSGQRKAVIP